jgi:hypothetical protein
MDHVAPAGGVGQYGTRAPGSIYASPLIDVLFAMATAALFVEDAVGPGKSFLFIVLTAVLAAIHAPLLLRRSSIVAIISWPLLAFLAVHIGFALRLGEDVFQLKMVQALLSFAFAATFALRYSQRSMATYYKVAAVLVLAVAIGSAAWHISIGRVVSWKHLWETKSAFTLLPFVMYAYLSARSQTARRLAPLIVAVFAVFILMSGERKAYVILGLALVLLVNVRNPITYILPLAILLAQPVVTWIDPTGYVEKQISTFGPKDEAEFSVSDAQREWQFNYAKSMVAAHPIMGVGTNGYLPIVRQEFATATVNRDLIINPGLGIHGEYLRVLVENGVIGLAMMLWLVISSAVHLLRRKHNGRPRSRREQILGWLLFFTLMMRIGTEAYDTIMAVCYCMLPYIANLRLDSRPVAAQPVTAPPARAAAVPRVQGYAPGLSADSGTR